jgi:hypothetical protein
VQALAQPRQDTHKCPYNSCEDSLRVKLWFAHLEILSWAWWNRGRTPSKGPRR